MDHIISYMLSLIKADTMNELQEENVFNYKSSWNRWSAKHFRETGDRSYPEEAYHFSELHAACRVGSIARVKEAVRNGANIEGRASCDARPLHIACGQGTREIVQFLLKIGANVNVKDLLNQTPIFKVNGPQTEELIADLYQNGADVYAKDLLNRTALDVACVERNFQKVQALAGKGLDTVQLHLRIACANGDLDIVQCLIENGADVVKFRSKWLSVLHFAVYNNHVDVVRLLVKHGCKLSRRGMVSPLHLAVSRGHVSMVQFMLHSGIDPNKRDKKGVTALHYACSFLQPGVIGDLLERGANPNAKDNDQFSPLIYLLRNECACAGENTSRNHEACDNRLIQLLCVLLENGVQLEPNSETRSTSSRIGMLNSDSDSDDDSIYSLDLHEAIKKGHIEAVLCLIKAGMTFGENNFFMHDELVGSDMSYNPLELLRVSRWCVWQYAAGVEVPSTCFLTYVLEICAEFLEHPSDGFIVDETTIDAVVDDVRLAEMSVEWLLRTYNWPRSLFFLCCIRVRGLLKVTNGTNIFPAVNRLQVPHTVKDALKLSHLSPKLEDLPAVPWTWICL